MALMLLTEYFVSKVFVDSLLMITTYYWLGQASFFYQVGVCCLYNQSFCAMLPSENFSKWLSVVCPKFICATLDKRYTSLFLKPAYEDLRRLLCCGDRFSRTTIYMHICSETIALLLQGNSNSLSTIDVSAGYKGMVGYNPAVQALLMMCNTYAGPIFWMIALFDAIKRNLSWR